MTDENVILDNIKTVDHESVEHFILNGGNQSDRFTIASTSAGTAVTVNGGPESDSINIGDGNDIDNIRGEVAVNGGPGANSLHIDDSQDTAGVVYAGTFIFAEDSYTFRTDSFQKSTTISWRDGATTQERPALSFSSIVGSVGNPARPDDAPPLRFGSVRT